MLAMNHPTNLQNCPAGSCGAEWSTRCIDKGQAYVSSYLVKLKHAQDSVAGQGQDQLVGHRGLIPGIVDCGVGPQDVLLLITPKLPAHALSKV